MRRGIEKIAEQMRDQLRRLLRRHRAAGLAAGEMPHTTPAPLTEDAFLADRQRFWGAFTNFTLVSLITVVVILVLMTIFLV